MSRTGARRGYFRHLAGTAALALSLLPIGRAFAGDGHTASTRPTVEHAELTRVTSSGGGPASVDEPWRGLDLSAAEELLGQVETPPRSPALHTLWIRLITANGAAVASKGDMARFMAARGEALYRSGLFEEVGALMEPLAVHDPTATVLSARADIALGRRKGCTQLRRVAARLGDVAASLRGDAILGLGYCAIADGETSGVGLLGETARDHGLVKSPGLDVLDAVAAGRRPKAQAGALISPIDYRLLEISGVAASEDVAAAASPPLLAVLAKDKSPGTAARLTAAEAAARLNILSPGALAGIYREEAARQPERASAGASRARYEKAYRRAALFVAAEHELDPTRKARAIQAYLEDARASGDYVLALRVIGPQLDALSPTADLAWFAETAIEINLAAGHAERVVSWVDSGPGKSRLDAIEHWLALVDIADPDARTRRGANFALVEELALRGAFSPEALHRLATVLDALDYDVPAPLRDVASRTPQPDGGHLPDAGVLSDLADAAKKREFGRVVLLLLTTLGPNGPEGTHVIALGDALRGLMRAGLGADAHRLGLEALLAFWPRTSAAPSREPPR